MAAIIWMAIVTVFMIDVTVKTWKHSQNRWYKLFSLVTTLAMTGWTVFNLITHLINK